VDCHMVQEYISAVGMKKSMKDRFQMDWSMAMEMSPLEMGINMQVNNS
jgi:hypothetical protein